MCDSPACCITCQLCFLCVLVAVLNRCVWHLCCSGLGLGRVPSMSVAGAGAAAGASPGLSLDPDSKQSFDRGDGKRGNPSGNNYDDKGDAKGEGKRRVSVVGEEAGNEDELDEETKAAMRNAHIHVRTPLPPA